MVAKKISAADMEFISNHRSDMTVRDIADAVGCSKSNVHRIMKQMAPEEGELIISAKTSINVSTCDEVELLREHAAYLRKKIRQVSDPVAAKLSSEYRETLARISELEGSKKSKETSSENEPGGALDAIFRDIAGD